MVEIAICLAIIGFALVAIIGVLPIGMNTQRDNREETLINQDATVFIEAIRNGARGLDDLTNYVYTIINYWGKYNANGSFTSLTPFTNYPSFLNSGTNIIGLLSTPEYTDDTNDLPIQTLMFGGISNHIVAYVHSLSGPAVEKPPQNANIVGDSFGYRILCVNAPVAVDTNIFNLSRTDPVYIYNQQLGANLHELRLTFLWPQLPNGSVGSGRQTFRTMVAGQIVTTNIAGQVLYFYQPQSFINVTNAP